MKKVHSHFPISGIIYLISALFLLQIACKTSPSETEKNDTKKEAQTAEKKADKKLLVVATTSMIGDAIKNVADEEVEIVSLMGAGVDPHLYKATPRDVRMLQNADMIFYNGLYLEAKLEEVLEKLAKKKTVVAVGEAIPEERKIKLGGEEGKEYDPHIWFDVENWVYVVEKITSAMKEEDDKKAATYEKNGAAYVEQLKQLHETTKQSFQAIPKERRILITAHDAFEYFGRAYDIEVKGLQGISTAAEFGLKDVQEMVDLISDKKIKAVFVESSVSSKGMEAVIEGCKKRGHNVVNGGSLYSDAMGEVGTKEGTYIGMVEHNVKRIIEALGDD